MFKFKRKQGGNSLFKEVDLVLKDRTENMNGLMGQIVKREIMLVQRRRLKSYMNLFFRWAHVCLVLAIRDFNSQ